MTIVKKSNIFLASFWFVLQWTIWIVTVVVGVNGRFRYSIIIYIIFCAWHFPMLRDSTHVLRAHVTTNGRKGFERDNAINSSGINTIAHLHMSARCSYKYVSANDQCAFRCERAIRPPKPSIVFKFKRCLETDWLMWFRMHSQLS